MHVIFLWVFFLERETSIFATHIYLYTFTGWFFSVPWLETKSRSLKQNSLTNWAIPARVQIWFLKHFLGKFPFNLKFMLTNTGHLTCSSQSGLFWNFNLNSTIPYIVICIPWNRKLGPKAWLDLCDHSELFLWCYS